MRVIKFRGKQQTWIYGGISIFNGEATIFDCECPANSAYQVDLNTVGQFTGLTDKNGKEIYEGDIYAGDDGSCYVVFFKNGCFCGGKTFKSSIPLGFEENELIEIDYAEVIGNVHENSGLL